MSSTAAWQLFWGLLTLIALYVLASGARRTVAIGVLLVLIPFQFVDTRYATSSVLMAYALAVILLINGGLRVRMLLPLGLILLAYFVSLAFAGRELMSYHIIFVFQFTSCLVVFLLAYNFARLVESERSIIDVLLLMNVLVGIYCVLQLTAGPGEGFVPFGIEEFRFNPNREASDPRLTGPFKNAGTTAAYFMLMTLVAAVEMVFSQGSRRRLVQFLIVLNLVGLVATANRGAFLTLLVFFPVMLFAFRRELGPKVIVAYLIGGVAVLAIASLIVVAYTDFGQMYDRLGQVTETEDGVPTTRADTWPVAIEKIKKDPWLGEGPYFPTEETAEEMGWARSSMDPFPHSLYLYLLRTVGVLGLAAVIGFFLHAWLVLWYARRRPGLGRYQSALVRLGLMLIAAFLVEQIRLEFNRLETMDYGHFIFALVGLFVGGSDRDGGPAVVAVPRNG
ncbi:MAG: O-antigen ligase family protein [Gammaproteobacteria bacterium]|nr:MAG: O-antigen ligase family protein [Gammaproteobacteria bacterium]